MTSFASRLIAWQRLYGRHDLPWQVADGTTRCAQATGAGVPSNRLLPQTAGFASNVSRDVRGVDRKLLSGVLLFD